MPHPWPRRSTNLAWRRCNDVDCCNRPLRPPKSTGHSCWWSKTVEGHWGTLNVPPAPKSNVGCPTKSGCVQNTWLKWKTHWCNKTPRNTIIAVVTKRSTPSGTTFITIPNAWIVWPLKRVVWCPCCSAGTASTATCALNVMLFAHSVRVGTSHPNFYPKIVCTKASIVWKRKKWMNSRWRWGWRDGTKNEQRGKR